MLKPYVEYGLSDVLSTIRRPDRYQGMNGANVLTNALPMEDYQHDSVRRCLAASYAAGQQADESFRPDLGCSPQGLSYGLNPYTDWSLSQLQARPTHWYIFLGIDFYSISSLGDGEDWFDYLDNPFSDTDDKYWHNVWAWLLGKYDAERNAWQTPIAPAEASEFIRRDGGGFIFHNRIPYLRPAGFKKSGTDWHELEWRKRGVKADCLDDLRTLKRCVGERVMAFCTGKDSEEALLEAGFGRHQVMNWSGHPSQVFYPSTLLKAGKWFRGVEHFQACPVD